MLRSRTGRRIAEYRDALRIKALDALEWSGFACNFSSGPTGVQPVYLLCAVDTGNGGWQLFWNDFDEDAVGENSATEQVNATVAGKAAQHGLAGSKGNCAFGGFRSAAAG